MNIQFRLLLTILAVVNLLAACAIPAALSPNPPPTEIYYKDGRVAYVASCRAVNWGPCLEKAGMVCKEAGYAVLEKTNSRSYGEDEKELVFACNGKPAASH